MFDRTPRYIASILGSDYPKWAKLLVTCGTAYGIINLLSLKSYLLFFQHRYHTAFENKIWAQAINNNWDNWYIRNKNKWGNFQYILKWLFIPVCIEPFITAFGEYIWGFIFNISLEIIMCLTPILLLLVFVFKLGHFYDSFGIRTEMLMQCSLFIIGIAIYFPIIFICHPFLSQQQYDAMYELIQGIFIMLIFTILAISCVYYPLYLIKKYESTHKLALVSHSSLHRKSVNLSQCFTDYQLFRFFMNHLVHEFATESALFVVEWCQIKNAYQILQNGVINITKSDTTNGYVQLVIDLNETLPTIPRHSLIDKTISKNNMNKFITTYMISEDKNINNMSKIQISQQIPESGILQKYANNIKLQTKALYDKYICDKSSTQINIPFELKTAARELILKLDTELLLKFHPSQTEENDHDITCNNNNIRDGDLWCSLDDICINILGLLLNPYARFKLGNQYIEYINSTEYKSKMEIINDNYADIDIPSI